MSSFTAQDEDFLQTSVDLARTALEAGDEPFGSVLVDADGGQLFADRNRVAGGDHTRHPEFEIARWAAANLSPDQRASSTVYTSGEHCPMCAAAHAWVGLGRIVYAASSEQLAAWHDAWGVEPGPVATLPINVVAPHVEVVGPHPQFSEQVRRLHAKLHGIEVR